MALFIGIVLSAAVAVMARWVGFDRSRAFYPTVVMVVASYYVLFAVVAGSPGEVLAESLVMVAFVAAAIAGFRSSAWIVVAALVGHGVFDAVRPMFMADSSAPRWWPTFCAAYDVGAGAWLALLLLRRSREAPTTHPPVPRPRSGEALSTSTGISTTSTVGRTP